MVNPTYSTRFFNGIKTTPVMSSLPDPSTRFAGGWKRSRRRCVKETVMTLEWKAAIALSSVRRQSILDGLIRRQHLDPRDLSGFHPSEFVTSQGFRDSFLDSAAVNQKKNGIGGIVVKNDFEEISNLDADSQFFL
jgi:hypothetical protein